MINLKDACSAFQIGRLEIFVGENVSTFHFITFQCMASGMVHGFVRDADRKSRVWLKVDASPQRAAVGK
jgi:hypothetical protein